MANRVLERLGDLIFPGSEPRLSPDWFGAHADMVQKYQLYNHYVSGDVFQTVADPEVGLDSGLKYPLKLNLCREWSAMMGSYLYGQYDDVVVTHSVKGIAKADGEMSGEEERRVAKLDDFLLNQWLMNSNDSLAMTAAMDNAIYGGVAIKTVYDSVDNRIRDEFLAPDIYIPRWHPTDVNRLLEVILAYEISRDDARDVFNLSQMQWASLPEAVLVWEKWDKNTFKLMVDKIQIRNNEANPLGHIPFTYIPWNRATSINHGYYGISTLEDVIGVQNELNERMADVGDGVAYASHPIRVVRNVTKRSGDLPVGPDAIWDLGIGFGNRQPDAFSLETHTNYGEAMKYMSIIEKYGREAVGLPPIAFGEDEGSQRSGTTLLIRFLPLTQQIKRARLYWRAGLTQRAQRVLELGAKFGNAGQVLTASDVKDRVVNVGMAPILPKDVTDKVNEWAIRIGGGFGTPEEAYEDLGHPEPAKAAEKALEYTERLAKSQNILKGVTANVAGPNGGNPNGRQDRAKGSSSSSPSGS